LRITGTTIIPRTQPLQYYEYNNSNRENGQNIRPDFMLLKRGRSPNIQGSELIVIIAVVAIVPQP